MSAPEPYANGVHLVVRGRVVVVTNHAPNSDAWRYTGSPADLAGDDIHFGHDEASPVKRDISNSRPVGNSVPATGRELLARAGLNLDVFDQEHTPLGDLLETVASLVRRGTAPPELHQAYLTYREAV